MMAMISRVTTSHMTVFSSVCALMVTEFAEAPVAGSRGVGL